MTDRTRWGIATTTAGSAGLSDRSDWSRWVVEGRLPATDPTLAFLADPAADLSAFAELEVRTIRWTIDWSRLEPHPGRWDTDAVDDATEFLRAARAAGIEVWAVLHDGPLPGWFVDDERGFDDTDGLRHTWPRHVDRVAETFGDLVGAWVPILDPFTRALEGHLVGTRPPGRTDPERFLDAWRTMHLASFEALRLLRSGQQPVVCCIDTCPTEAAVQGREPDERDAARAQAAAADRLRFVPWMRALRDGVISIPYRAETEIDGLAGGYDIVGFTYRGANSVFADGSTGPYPADARVAADGRSPWTEGLGLTVRRLAHELPGRPLALLGTGVVTNADDWRSEVLDGSILELDRAVDDGIRVGDAFWETGIDGWTPECGLAVADGLLDRDRSPRASAEVLRATRA
jgi:beta-glucosidase